jgi:hypothetical protein
MRTPEPSDRACALAVVRLSADGRRAVGVKSDVDPSVLAELCRVAVESRGNLPVDVWQIARNSRSNGLALVLVPYGAPVPDVPEPLSVLFEPVALDECDPRFAELAPVWGASCPARRRRRVGRVLKLVFVCAAGVAGGMLDLGLSNRIGENIARVVLCVCVAGALGLAVLWKRGRILIAPGAVHVERWGFRGGRTLRLTPSDSVLIAGPRGAAWQVSIWQGWKSYGGRFSDVEFKALLAAWRSPIFSGDS